jgi:hypothetical protein
LIPATARLAALEASNGRLQQDNDQSATANQYVAALAMTTFASDKPLNDARHLVVITLSDLVHALETDPTAQLFRSVDDSKSNIQVL